MIILVPAGGYILYLCYVLFIIYIVLLLYDYVLCHVFVYYHVSYYSGKPVMLHMSVLVDFCWDGTSLDP